MKRRVVVVVGLALVVLAGFVWSISKHGEPGERQPVRRCIDWTTEAPTRSEVVRGCGEPGDVLVGFSITDCIDDREFYASGLGWGFIGDTMTTFDRDDPRVAPEGVRASCEGGSDQ